LIIHILQVPLIKINFGFLRYAFTGFSLVIFTFVPHIHGNQLNN